MSLRPRSRLRPICFRAAALCLALTSTAGVFELALRIAGFGRNYTNPMSAFFEPDAEVGCHGKANFAGRFHRTDFDVLVEHDASGFRCPAIPVESASNDIYVLGDSFVWGYGVGQGDLLTDHMQQRLAGWRVHNVGLIGAGTVQEFLIFKKHVEPRLRPGDTVVLVFFGNDFGDNIGRNLCDRTYAVVDNGQVRLVPRQRESAAQQWKNAMRDHSYLCNLLIYCADQVQHWRVTRQLVTRETRPLPTPEQVESFTHDRSPAVQVTRHYLAELKNACSCRQVRLLSVWVPGQAELGEDDVTSTSDLSLPEETACHQAFERLTRELQIETVGLTTPMVAAQQGGRHGRMTFAHDFHWTAAGHAIAGEVIAEAVRSSLH